MFIVGVILLKIVRFIALIACILFWIPVFFNVGNTDIGIYKIGSVFMLVATIAVFFIGNNNEHKDE